MKKLKLNLDELKVESFGISSSDTDSRSTVKGYSGEDTCGVNPTCDYPTCLFTACDQITCQITCQATSPCANTCDLTCPPCQ